MHALPLACGIAAASATAYTVYLAVAPAFHALLRALGA
jgi:hypothetical protein